MGLRKKLLALFLIILITPIQFGENPTIIILEQNLSPIEIEEGRNITKKFTVTSSNHFGYSVTAGFRNFVYVPSASKWCKFEFNSPNFTVETSTDLSGDNWAVSETVDVEPVGGGAHAIFIGAMRVELGAGAGGTDRIHLAFLAEVAGPLFKTNYWYSDDGGENWTKTQGSIQDGGVGFQEGGDLPDIFQIGGTWYAFFIRGDGEIFFADLSVFSVDLQQSTEGVNTVFVGHVDGSNYHYPRIRTGTTLAEYYFNGSTEIFVKDIGIGLNISFDFTILIKHGILKWLVGNDGNDGVSYYRIGNRDYLQTDITGAGIVIVSWDEANDNEALFVIFDGTDDVYTFSTNGVLLKIGNNFGITFPYFGYGKYLQPYEIEPISFIINKGFISKEKLSFRILTFESPETSFSKGDSIVLTEDDGTGIFMGNVASVSTIAGTQSQFITAFSPEKDDLELSILENFGTVDENAIFDILYANHFKFYYAGTIDDTGNTQTLPSSIRNAHGILKDLEPFGARVIYNEWDGKQHYDEADEVTGITLTDTNSQIVPNGITERGQEINAVVVKGGVDPNLPTDQEIPVGIAKVPGVSQQQLVPAIYNIPSLKTQAEVDARAALILASGPSALIVYKIQYFGDGTTRPIIPQIGRTVDLTNTEHSLTNEILIVQSWTYSLDDNSIIFFATNGLLFLTNNETQDVMNINTERIFQLARIVAARTVPGLVFYLDNNASDIGGYKKMLDTYAGDAKVTFTNTNAVDGEAIEEFATEPNEPGITLLDDGEYNVHIHARNTQAGSQDARIYFELYKRTVAPAETLIATSESTSILTATEADYNIHAHVSATELVATDRLVVKLIIGVSGGGAAPDIETFIQGTAGTVTTARFEMPSSSQVIANKVNKAGDTMTGDLTVTGLNHATTMPFKIATNTLMTISADDLRADVNLNARSGHILIASDAANAKNLFIFHDGTDSVLRSLNGAWKMRTTALNVRNANDNDYVDVNANAFNEVSTPLPNDPPDWKNKLPEFIKKDIVHPIIEEYEKETEVEYTDEEGIFQTRIDTVTAYRKIGEEVRIGLNVGMVARLALREVESLKLINADLIKRIVDLEKLIGVTK